MKLILLVLVAFAFSTGNSSAQSKVPGYMGKRFLFGYKFHFMPGYGKNPTANEDYDQRYDGDGAQNFFKINYFHEGFAEMVLSKRTSLVAKGIFSSGQFSPFIAGDYYSSGGTRASEWGKYNSFGGSLGYRLYSKHLAPLASYIGASVGWQQAKTEEYSFFGQVDFNGLSDFREIDPASGGTLFCGLEFGANRILFDKLVLNWSLEANLFLSSLLNFRFYENFGIDELSNSELEDEFVDAALYRMQRQQIVSFGIGIGFLP